MIGRPRTETSKPCVRVQVYWFDLASHDYSAVETELTGPHWAPATRQEMLPPTFWAAVMAFRVTGFSLSLLCSAKTSVLWKRCARASTYKHDER